MPFIVIDGGDGSGKTTLVANLKERWKDRKDVVYTREPGGSPYAEALRGLMLGDVFGPGMSAEVMFNSMWAARRSHIEQTILPALQENKLVVSDRFDSSTYSYQIYGQECTHLEDLFWEQRKVMVNDCQPDLYILLDLDPAIGLARETAQDHFGRRVSDFHKRVNLGLKEFMRHVPSYIIDASGSQEKIVDDFIIALDSIQKKLYESK